MAAQKLTRGRFAQIIIMLSILIAAFIWRTIDHDSTIDLTCEEDEKCTFYVNDTLFDVKVMGDTVHLSVGEKGWEVTDSANIKNHRSESQNWIFNPTDKFGSFSFKLEKKSESIKKQIRFRSQ